MLLSIIVPVFNVEKYIEKCLESILAIDFKDYEIILVLGHSSDNSNDICQEYKNKYNNITIVKQTGKGLSNARNCGLRLVNGRYVTFVDSDDFIISDQFNKTITGIKKLEKCNKNVDVIVSDFFLVNTSGSIVRERNQIVPNGNEFIGDCYTETFLKGNESIWNVWRYIYSAEFLSINSRLFVENCYCEDIDFTVRSFLQTNNFYYIHRPYYCYCGNRENSLYNKSGIKNIEDLFAITVRLMMSMQGNDGLRITYIKNKLIRETVMYLPCVYEVEDNLRGQVIQLFKENKYMYKQANTKILKLIYVGMSTVGIKSVAAFLYVLKKIRRKLLYQ